MYQYCLAVSRGRNEYRSYAPLHLNRHGPLLVSKLESSELFCASSMRPEKVLKWGVCLIAQLTYGCMIVVFEQAEQ